MRKIFTMTGAMIIGFGIAMAIGVATNDVSTWVPLGAALGAAFAAAEGANMSRRNNGRE